MDIPKNHINRKGFLLPFVLFIFFLFTLLLNTVVFLHTQKMKQYHQNILYYQGEIAYLEFVESYPNVTISEELLPFINWQEDGPIAINFTFNHPTYHKTWKIPYRSLNH
ncbi:hypothetical protein [Atopobacter phocae]|uniref:hypothetical protein n=1 Tax=Atopobacter phocae TaxID=136492 RepID=UPI00047229B5|nr:hypothetical protein [Atopobacter phocae]